MTSEKQQEKDRNLNAMVGNLLSPDQPEPEIAEELLWAYALNALELSQREQVLQLLAQSERARKTLERMEQSIATVARTRKAPVAERVRQRAMQTLADVGRDLSSVAAVIVATGNTLVAAFGEAVSGPDAATLDLAPATLGKSGDPGALNRLTGPGGMTLSVTPLGEGIFEIDVRIEPPVEGKVTLFKLETKDGKKTDKQIGLRVALENGHALLTSCPTGVIKITGPDAREMILCLESDEP